MMTDKELAERLHALAALLEAPVPDEVRWHSGAEAIVWEFMQRGLTTVLLHKTQELLKWLETTGASLTVTAVEGDGEFTVDATNEVPQDVMIAAGLVEGTTQLTETVSSPSLDDAIRGAQHLLDAAAAKHDRKSELRAAPKGCR